MELFSVKSVQKFRPVWESEASNLVMTISQNVGRTINLGKEFFPLTIGISARAGFGKRVSEEKEFAVLSRELVDLTSGFSVADMYPSRKFLHLISGVRPRLERVYKGMDKVFGNIISEHRKRKVAADQEDLADVLLRIQKDGLFGCPLTDDNIKAVILCIAFLSVLRGESEDKDLNSGRVAHAFFKSMYKNVDETGLDKLNYLKMVITETLRLHPPAPLLLARECREQCQINGFDIPVNSKVIFNAWAIGRDPQGFGLIARALNQKDSKIVQLISRGQIFITYHLVPVEGFVPGSPLHTLILCLDLHKCCTILIGNSVVD